MKKFKTIEQISLDFLQCINEDDDCPAPEKQPLYNWSDDRSTAPDHIVKQQQDYNDYKEFVIEVFDETIDSCIDIYSELELQALLCKGQYHILDIVKSCYEEKGYIPTYFEIVIDVVREMVIRTIDEF